jgi:hypothetical protein
MLKLFGCVAFCTVLIAAPAWALSCKGSKERVEACLRQANRFTLATMTCVTYPPLRRCKFRRFPE